PPVVFEIVEGLRRTFQSRDGAIALFPASGTGATEAAIVNTLNPGDRVLAFNNGAFSHSFAEVARRHAVEVDEVELAWDRGVPPDLIRDRLSADTGHTYQAVLVVHNETSTGSTTGLAAVRRAMDGAGHPAMLIVDAVSSLASLDFRFDEWGIDVALAGSQKGLMLPPGLGIVCIGARALRRAEEVTTPRAFFDWRPVLKEMERGYFPYTPATLLLYGLREALRMLGEEGLPQVFARHRRLADAVRAAVRAWKLPVQCREPAEYSHTLTAVVVPEGINSDAVRRAAETHFNLSLGAGLGRLAGKVFRIGHLGALNDLEVLATVAGTELAMTVAGIRMPVGTGVAASQQVLLEQLRTPAR
ncbi:MAG TPA: aminotransferase class V-fold PLP-dependent enzyme, partial [bacterium]|nr:aminotransferase class V-fold PLP-dependent enzyme [bacterium]